MLRNNVAQAEVAQTELVSAMLLRPSSEILRARRRADLHAREIDRSDLALLPRLPETANELGSIAIALSADPTKVLYLRKDASERTVREIDISRFRVVAFATHGRVPGDLNGLTQPASARHDRSRRCRNRRERTAYHGEGAGP
jgi:CHAT domain-containing protein